MPTYFEQLQKAYHRYEAEHDNDPAGTREVVEWAIPLELDFTRDVEELQLGQSDDAA